MQPVRRFAILLLLLALAAGCGGGSDQTSPPGTTAPTSTDVVTVKQPPNTAKPGEDPTGTPQFTVTLTGESTTPTAGRPWRYTVRAKAKPGLSSGATTAKMRVFVDDQLVDTLGFFAFDGVLVRTHVWPRALRGESVELQAEVEGDGGTQRAVFPVSIR
jgi:hypothetical protein